jgi:methylenetetrahydrofolate--tRNA-(uracil-5-)-methyltransferase
VCGVMLAQSLLGLPLSPPPETTALGGVITHITRAGREYQPSNVTWAWLPPVIERRLKKRERYEAAAARALADLATWMGAPPPRAAAAAHVPDGDVEVA